MRLRLPWLMLMLILAGGLLVGCTALEKPVATPELHIANPASENCVKLGGTLKVEVAGDSSEYGLCVFSETMACEEWALFNGLCPAGGIDISNIQSPQARYCLVTGNQYTTMEYDTAPPSIKELCVMPDGGNCELLDFYTGRCRPAETATP